MNEPLTAQDFVFYKENDQIMSGGYSVDSILLNQNLIYYMRSKNLKVPWV